MVETQHNGKVIIDCVSHKIIERLIVEVTGFSQEGMSFFRDKKMSANAVNTFIKNDKEKSKLVKIDNFYNIESIKKFWGFVLRIIIEYVTLEPRFDRVRAHHFVLLNHFRHKVKISFPFYIYTSMTKNIESYKKCLVKNLALHEGLLLLIFVFLKTQTRVKSIRVSGGSSENTASSDSGEVRVVKSVKSETPKAKPSSYFPSKKSPKCPPPNPPTPHPKESSDESDTELEEADSVAEKESELEDGKEKGNDKKEVTPLVTQDNPKKRKFDQTPTHDHLSDNTNFPPSPTTPTSPLEVPILPPKEMIEIMVEKGGEAIRKNKRRAWRNFNMDSVSMGIVREPTKIQVLGDLDSSTHYDELVDLTLLVLFDNVREMGFNFLNNAKNNLIDNFSSIKWLFRKLRL